MSDLGGEPTDPYVQRLRDARDSSAVLKVRIVNFRSVRPGVPILAFEGGDDKIVYNHWIRRLRPGLQYEPFPCDGKREVRKLKNLASRDLSGLEENLYYLVDRDFDDLTGFANDNHVFMTTSYSVENYLVSPGVVDEILKNEFPCHALPEVREEVIGIFVRTYEAFLETTKRLNFRVFVSRRAPVDTLERLPTRLSSIALIELDRVQPSALPPEEAIKFVEDQSPEVLDALWLEFEELEPSIRYRGKFAYKFFIAWLTSLANELQDRQTDLFRNVEANARARVAELVLGSFAAKSELPEGFADFLNTVQAA